MPKRSEHPPRAFTAVIGYRPTGPSLSPGVTPVEGGRRPGQRTAGRPRSTPTLAIPAADEVRAGRRGGPLDALYALAFLSSGDPRAAQQAVIDAFSDLCGHPATTPTCQRRRWRFLADQMHLASESSRGPSGPGPAPFRDAELSPLQREAVALRLGGASHRQGARLVGVPVSTFGHQLRIGLQALAGVMSPDPACGQPPRASLCCGCPGMRP